MHPFATGAAFVDLSGEVLAADRAFLDRLGLRAGEATASLRERVERTPELRTLLSGDGPARVRTAGTDGAPVEIERFPARSGMLLVAREMGAQEWLEHAIRSRALGRLASGVSHEIKNLLNAINLRIELLPERLGGAADGAPATAAPLASIRDLIGRVNEVVRRFLDVTDPAAPLGYTDVGMLLADAAALFGHEARGRQIELTLDAPPAGGVRTRCDAARVGRLVVGLMDRAITGTPEGGKVQARVEVRGPEAVLRLRHTAGDPDPDMACYTEVAAAAADSVGGRFSAERHEGWETLSLALPRNDRE